MLSLQALQQTFEQRIIDMGCDWNRPSAFIMLIPFISTFAKNAIQKNVEACLERRYGYEGSDAGLAVKRHHYMTNSRKYKNVLTVEYLYITGLVLQIIFVVAWFISHPPSMLAGFAIGTIALAHWQFVKSPLSAYLVQEGNLFKVFMKKENKNHD